MERKQSSGLRRIFTIPFLLVLIPAEGALTLQGLFSNPAGQSLTFTKNNIPKATMKIRRNPLLRFLSMIRNFYKKSRLFNIQIYIVRYLTEKVNSTWRGVIKAE